MKLSNIWNMIPAILTMFFSIGVYFPLGFSIAPALGYMFVPSFHNTQDDVNTVIIFFLLSFVISAIPLALCMTRDRIQPRPINRSIFLASIIFICGLLLIISPQLGFPGALIMPIQAAVIVWLLYKLYKGNQFRQYIYYACLMGLCSLLWVITLISGKFIW